MTIKPLKDRILVKVLDAEEKTASGIILGKAERDYKKGKILAVGPGIYLQNGDVAPVCVSVDDIVLFMPYSGIKVDSDMLLLGESELLGIMD